MMIRRVLLYSIVVSVFFYVSCIRSDKQVPSKYIQPDKMKFILYDMYLADAFNSERLVRDRTLNHQTETVNYYKQILRNHGFSDKQFFESMDYYKKHPAIYRELTDSLQQYGQKLIGKNLNEKSPAKNHGNNLKDTARPARHRSFHR
jgi:Neuraminidase (sialidase)